MKLTLCLIVINIMICPKYQHFEMLSGSEKNNIVMSSEFAKHTAEYLYKAYYKRRSLIYN